MEPSVKMRDLKDHPSLAEYILKRKYLHTSDAIKKSEKNFLKK